MPQSEMRLIKSVLEYLPRGDWPTIDAEVRGFSVLYNHRKRRGNDDNFDFVYVGMAQNNVRGRLKNHANSWKKWGEWTHFSVFEVWDNISPQEIGELEGLFRHLYRWDSKANSLNIQRSYKPLQRLRRATHTVQGRNQFRWVKKHDGTRGPKDQA